MATLSTAPAASADQVVLVTGGAGGLGGAITSRFAKDGCTVVVADFDGEAAEVVASGLRERGARARSAGVDVTVRADVEEAVEDIMRNEGRIDVAVCLAGVVRNGYVSKIRDEDFRATIATHAEGTLNVMRAVLPHMRKRGYGRLVNMSSVAVRGSLGGASYGAAKGAIEGLTRSAALEVAQQGITANCVAPGLVDAGMFLTVPDDFQKSFADRIPMGRVATPEEIAAVVAFFASPEASYVTGQTLYVCGGSSLGF